MPQHLRIWESQPWRCYAVVFMSKIEQSSCPFSLSHRGLFYGKVVWKSNSLFMSLLGEGNVGGRQGAVPECVGKADKQLVQWAEASLAAGEQLSWESPLSGTQVNLNPNSLSQQDSGPLASGSRKPLSPSCPREQAQKLHWGLTHLFPCNHGYIVMLSPIKGSWAASSWSVPFS